MDNIIKANERWIEATWNKIDRKLSRTGVHTFMIW